jgi:hypothetical protein
VSRRGDGWTLERQRRFCEVLAASASVAQAADAVGLSRRSAYAFRNSAQGAAFARVWDQARDMACRAVVDEAVALAFQGRTVQVIEDGEIVTERRRNSPLRLLRTVERLRSESVLGDPRVVAASRDFARCLDLLEVGEAYPVPVARANGLSFVAGFIRERLDAQGARAGVVPDISTDTSNTPRHPELDSGSGCHPHPTEQVTSQTPDQRPAGSRGDDGGVGVVSEPTPAALSPRWTTAVQRRFCEALARCGNVDKACKSVGKGRTGAYDLRDRAEGKAFAIAWDAALLVVSEEMMDTALEMACEGSVDQILRKGKLIRVRRTSDAQVMLDTVARVKALRGALPPVAADFGVSLDQLGSGEALRVIAVGGGDADVRLREEAETICRSLLGADCCPER